jgi:hypothetical protein
MWKIWWSVMPITSIPYFQPGLHVAQRLPVDAKRDVVDPRRRIGRRQCCHVVSRSKNAMNDRPAAGRKMG